MAGTNSPSALTLEWGFGAPPDKPALNHSATRNNILAAELPNYSYFSQVRKQEGFGSWETKLLLYKFYICVDTHTSIDLRTHSKSSALQALERATFSCCFYFAFAYTVTAPVLTYSTTVF